MHVLDMNLGLYQTLYKMPEAYFSSDNFTFFRPEKNQTISPTLLQLKIAGTQRKLFKSIDRFKIILPILNVL